jgi:hypothetical protein
LVDEDFFALVVVVFTGFGLEVQAAADLRNRTDRTGDGAL